MFAWTSTFYAKKDGVYYNFDMKRQRDVMIMWIGRRRLSIED